MKIVLMDRDGTVIIDPPDYRVDGVDKIKLFPDTIEALKYLADNDYAVIIVTNQAGINEGRLTEEEFWQINKEFLKLLKPSGIKVLKTYLNSEGEGITNEWRKPGPAMLQQAAKDFNFNLEGTYMVGDHDSDIEAGINAGTRTILVKTANTNVEAPEATYTAQDLLEAAKYIVSH